MQYLYITCFELLLNFFVWENVQVKFLTLIMNESRATVAGRNELFIFFISFCWHKQKQKPISRLWVRMVCVCVRDYNIYYKSLYDRRPIKPSECALQGVMLIFFIHHYLQAGVGVRVWRSEIWRQANRDACWVAGY